MEAEPLLDLGHLTGAEQVAILDVLLRDSELHSQEQNRVSKLLQTESDPGRLRSMSGAWFSEQRAKRHQRGGADTVHASIRRKRRGKDLPLMAIEVFEGQKEENLSPSLLNTPPTPERRGEEEESEPERRGEEEERESERRRGEEERESERRRGEEEERTQGEQQKHRIGPEQQQAPVPKPRTRAPLSQNRDLTPTLQDKTQDLTLEDRDGMAEFTESGDGLSRQREETAEIEDRVLQSQSPPLQLDSVSEKETDFSSATELDPSRIGSISSLQSSYTLSGSMLSLFSLGGFGGVAVSGRVQLSLQYNAKEEELQVTVCCCQNLAPARRNRSDPYVKVYLLPDKTSRSKRKTSVKKKTLNPVYDEILRFKVRKLDLRDRCVSVSVWHHERLSVRRNLFLGEAELSLHDWDWGRSQPTWHVLQPRVQVIPDAVSSRGTILLSLKFISPGSEGGGLPLTGELHVWLREAVGLLPCKRRAPSSYVTSCVLPDESGSSGQRTRVIGRSVAPLFNHTMVYDGLQPSDLPEACTELQLYDQHTHSSGYLGGVRLSTGTGVSYGQAVCWMDSTEEEISVWNALIQNPDCWVDTTLPIRTNLQPR